MRTALAFFMVLCSLWGWGQTTESFETGLPSSYTSSLQTAALGTGTWQIRDVIAGTTGVQTGTKSAQIRSATNAQIITPTLSGGVGMVSFYVTSSTTSGAYQVNVSSDSGVTWTPATGSPFTIGTTKTLKSITINNSSVNKIQVYRTGGTIYIDDFTWTGYAPTCTTDTASFTPTIVNKTTTDAPFTNAFSTNNTSAKVYSSGNATVATVDSETGLVTIKGAGSTTISVTQIADGTYCAVNASYTLNVTSSSPQLSISGVPTNHGGSCVGVSTSAVQYTITNNGGGAASNVAVSSDNTQFVVSNLSSTSIAAGGTATFNVTFTPSGTGAQGATITVTGTDSNSPTLALTGTGTATVAGGVSTIAESNVGSTAVRLNGNLTTLGTCPATTEKGFVWGSNANPTIADQNTSVTGLSTGAYFYDLTTGLTPNTTYHYRAYIKDANNVYAYGDDRQFTTLAVADHLAFVNVPASGSVGNSLASFTVEARRPDNSVDTFYTGNVILSKASGAGTLSGTLSQPFVNGVATFNDIKFNAPDTFTLHADHGSFSQITSGNIDVTVAPSYLLVENFDYNTGNIITVGDKWSVASSNAAKINVIDSSISYPGYLSSGIGREVQIGDVGEDVGKDFVQQTEDVIYASALINVSKAAATGDYFFSLSPGATNTNFRGRVYVKSSGTGIQFGIGNGGSPVYGSTVYALNTTYVLAVKYDISNSATTTAARIYINPVLNAAEPLTGWVVSNDVTTAQNIGAVILRQGTAANAPILKLDGIRVSKQWEDIVGAPQAIWSGSAWSNTTGPDASMPAIIDGDYSGGSFESASLQVNAGKTLTVTNYVRSGNVTNNGHIIVANNANFVQTGTFTAGGSSSFKVRKDSKAVKRQAYINWSSPMQGSAQTLNAFSYGKLADGITNQSGTGTLDNRFYTYNNGVYVQVADPSVTTFSTPGTGYLIRTPNDFTTTPQVFHGQFEGKTPNSGDISYDHGNLIGGSFVLLGNPYPGAISIEDFWAANPDTTGTVYIWDSGAMMDGSGNYSGSNYSAYSSMGSVPANAIDGYIPAGQGFFVERTYIDPYIFKNSMRRGDQTGIFSKSPVQDKFWLQMTAPSGAKPQMLVGFNAAAGTGYDQGYDAKMIDNNADVLYTTVDDKKLVIDAHGIFDDADTFNLNANFSTSGNYTVGILQKEGIFSGIQNIYLKDNVTGTVTDLSAGSYTFSAEPGLQVNRFTVLFKSGTVLGTDSAAKSGITVFSSGSEVHVKADQNISAAELYDMSGRLLGSSRAGARETVMTVSYRGAVVLKVRLENGMVQTRKLMLK